MQPQNQEFIIRSNFNNMALDVDGGSSSVYAKVLTYKQHGNSNQVWKIKNYKDSTDTYYL